jgi:aminoglycoside phosphotransferase (APT) family kinase protein
VTTTLHDDEVPVDEGLVRRLVDTQFPQWAGLPLSPAGSGTDNRMFRLGGDLVVRLPRRPATAADVAKEQAWIPRLAPALPIAVPAPVALGGPGEGYPFGWSVLRWIEGEEPGPETVDDWERLGRDLARVVAALHGADSADAVRGGRLAWYRGLPLASVAADVDAALADCRRLDGLDLDLDEVERVWRGLLATPDPDVAHVWLHGDLRPANLLVRGGRLVAVLDFGALSLGRPAAEHAALWHVPRAAGNAYRAELGLDDDTWARARGWALAVSLLAMPYYWRTWPEFAHGGVDKVRRILAED